MSIASTRQQVFPQVERVRYRSAPLIDVICQVQFPADLQVQANPPVQFQQRVRQTFPILNQKTQSVLHGLPSELGEALEAVLPPAGTTTTWAFSTENGKRTLELNKDKLTLIARDYQLWGQFFGAFRSSLDALVELYKPQFFTRIGLRYRDLIRRSALDLQDTPWSDLLEPHVLGELAIKEVGDRAEEAMRNLLLVLPERGAKVRLQHGFAEAETEGRKEQCYLIDCDFFVDRTEVGHVHEVIEYLHDNAFRYFRWCITNRLHTALHPESPRSD